MTCEHTYTVYQCLPSMLLSFITAQIVHVAQPILLVRLGNLDSPDSNEDIHV